jgi:predicted glycosyltransferase
MIHDVGDQHAARVMFCCNEAVGLGHMRRTLALAEYLRTHTRLRSQLIVTGSPVAQNFPLPPGADYIKLPAVMKVGSGQYASRSMPIPFSQVEDMRRDILLSAARHFRPDILLVDHAPAGIGGEIIATLRYLKDNSPHTRLVLGLRDIVDEAAKVRQAWARTRVYDLLDHVYDRILIYGQRDIYDGASEYGLSPRAAEKTRYMGYLRRANNGRRAEQVRAELGLLSGRLVVVTAGGGADGHALLATMIAALKRRPARFDCLLVAGPLMPARERDQLTALAGDQPGLRLLDFAEDMTDYIGAADVVVSMGGYNTVCETLSFERPAIIVPRVAPSQEQLLRAQALSRHGLARMIHPSDLTPERLLAEITLLLEHPPHLRALLSLDGLPRVAAELHALLQQSRTDDYAAHELGGPAVGASAG